MSGRRFFKKYSMLMIPLLLALVTILACVYYNLQARNIAEQLTYNAAMDSAEEQIKTLQAALDGRFTTLESYARMFAMEEDFAFDSDKTMAALGPLNDGKYLFELYLVDWRGRAYASDGRNFSAADRDYFQASMNRKRAIEQVEASRLTNLPRFIFSVPLIRDGQVTGVVAGSFNMGTFRQLLISASASRPGYSFVCDAEGNIIISTDHELFSQTKNIFEIINDGSITQGAGAGQLAADLNNKESGYAAYSFEGVDRFAVYTHTGVNDWTLFNVLPDEVIGIIVGNTAKVANTVTVVVALLSLAMLLFAYYMQRRSQRQREIQRRDFRAAATQSGRMLRIYNIKDDLFVDSYNEDSGISWRDTPEQMVADGVVASESADEYLNFYRSMREGLPSGAVNARLQDAEGVYRWYKAEYTLMTDRAGQPDHAVITLFDNSEQMNKELAYDLRQSELAALKENCFFYMEANLMTGQVEAIHGEPLNYYGPDIMETDLHTLIEQDSRHHVYPEDAPRFREFFDKNRLIALHAQNVFSDSLEFRVVLNEEPAWMRVTVQMVKYPYSEDIKIYLIFHDISEERRLREQLLDMASSDSLTGLLNREATMQDIEQYLLGQGAGGVHALFMIDLDDFKLVNDTLGHQVGDAVLIDLAGVIRRSFRGDDIVGRVGGDEFFAFMKNADKPGVVQNKARELIGELQCVYTSGSRQMDLSGSIGISVYRGDTGPVKTLSMLYAEADAALYKAKAMGKSCYAFADELDAAAALSSSPADHHGAMALNLRLLLNNLGGGVEIYHAAPGGPPTLLFCNESFLQLIGGPSEAEFRETYGGGAFSGAHPDDRNALIQGFNEALAENRQFQHTYRQQGQGGQYYWIAVTANFVKYEDGGYDVYAVYADAEHLSRHRAALEEKYRAFQSYSLNLSNNAQASFHLDLSADLCLGTAGQAIDLPNIKLPESAESFFSGLSLIVDPEEDPKSFRAAFDRQNLLERFRQDQRTLNMDRPFLIGERMVWLRVNAETVENPETHHIEAMVNFFDIDREMRLQLMVKRLLSTDYEFLGQVDVHTGRLTIFGGNTSMGSTLGSAQMQLVDVDYRSELPKALREIIRDEFYERALQAMDFDRLLLELEKADSYTCAFPTKAWGGMPEGFRQWRCGYIGQRRNTIMVSRTDITAAVIRETDALTGLYNPQGFYSRVRQRLDERPGEEFRLIRFDIDNFKVLNDARGFAVGDDFLRDFSIALQKRGLSSDCILGHLEADHFVALLSANDPEPETIMERIKKWLDDYPVDLPLTGHMGVYTVDEPDMEVSMMCDRALLALRSVKDNFSRRVGYYDESLRYKLLEEQALSGEMESALASGQFRVWFQPQFNYEDNTLIGAEALVRWDHPERGLLNPDTFIPLFERNGFITTLDEYVWDQSCAYIRKWMDASNIYLPVSVSVNISRIDIYTQHLPQVLQSVVDKHGVPTEMLKLEITETAYMQNPEQLMHMVKELRAIGFTIEMDDFGSGWSSLNTLKDVPVDILKLDMKFLSKGLDDQRGGNILSSVIRMAHWLKIPVIAEGVETKAQADYLKSLGCFYMQGFYFSQPLPAPEFEELLSRCRLGVPDRYADIDLTGVAAFWDPSAQTALLFNSFVGGAAILEYCNGNAEILRANDKFYQELATTRESYLQKQLHTLKRFDDKNRAIFIAMLEEAMATGAEAECEVQCLPLYEGGPSFWMHDRVKLLAHTGDHCLFYMASENITARKHMEEQLRIKTEALRSSEQQPEGGEYNNETH